MFVLLDMPRYRVTAIMALTWLAAAGPMPAFATLPVGHRTTMNLSAPDRLAPARAPLRPVCPEVKQSQVVRGST